MSEKANQFRIGLFVVVGVVIVLAGLFLFGIRSAFQPTYMFETYVTENVDGLSGRVRREAARAWRSAR